MRKSYILVALVLAGGLFLSSWTTATDGGLGKIVPYFDKLMHFLLFGTIAGLLYFGIRNSTKYAGVIAVCLTITIGLVDEFIQSFNVNRSAHVLDLVADVAGSVVVVIGCYLWILWRRINDVAKPD